MARDVLLKQTHDADPLIKARKRNDSLCLWVATSYRLSQLFAASNDVSHFYLVSGTPREATGFGTGYVRRRRPDYQQLKAILAETPISAPWFLKWCVLTLVVLDPRDKVHPGMALVERGHLALVLGLSTPYAGRHPVVVMRILVLMLLLYRRLFLSTVMNCTFVRTVIWVL